MIKYRIRFNFKKEEDSSVSRENHINDILSDIDSIESNEPIRKPVNGETILISGEEYDVVSVTISFEKQGDVTYYDFITLLESKKAKQNLRPGKKMK